MKLIRFTFEHLPLAVTLILAGLVIASTPESLIFWEGMESPGKHVIALLVCWFFAAYWYIGNDAARKIRRRR